MRNAAIDDVWQKILVAANTAAMENAVIAQYLEQSIEHHPSFSTCIGHAIGARIGDDPKQVNSFSELIANTFEARSDLQQAMLADLSASVTRNPACTSLIEPLLFFKGFQALQCYRVAHVLWEQGQSYTALLLQSKMAEVFSVDIHPAASIGKGVFIDHANGLVVGETAVIDDDVSLMHEVTLGGTGKDRGLRHPVIRNGVLLSAGAKVLGRIEVGQGAKVAACSVVLQDVPPFATVAGIPARVIGYSTTAASVEMNQTFSDANTSLTNRP